MNQLVCQGKSEISTTQNPKSRWLQYRRIHCKNCDNKIKVFFMNKIYELKQDIKSLKQKICVEKKFPRNKN